MTWHVLLHFFEFILGLNNVLLSMIDNETLVFLWDPVTDADAHIYERTLMTSLVSKPVGSVFWGVLVRVSGVHIYESLYCDSKNILDLSSLYIICYVAYISNLNLDLRDI